MHAKYNIVHLSFKWNDFIMKWAFVIVLAKQAHSEDLIDTSI